MHNLYKALNLLAALFFAIVATWFGFLAVQETSVFWFLLWVSLSIMDTTFFFASYDRAFDTP